MKKLPETDIAYIAAVLDTTGRLTTRKSAGHELPLVELNCKNYPLLDYLADVTSTATFATQRDYQRFGCQEHCAEKHVHTISHSARWSIVGAKATIVLYNIEPYVFLRRPEVEELLAIGLGCEARSNTIRDMRSKGWEIPQFASVTKAAVA
jgi:hypothetical protein